MNEQIEMILKLKEMNESNLKSKKENRRLKDLFYKLTKESE
jgi:hypothetical protein